MQLRRVHSVRSNVANSIRFALFVGSDFSDSISRPSNVEYSTSEARFSDVGFSIFDQPFVECRIFDTRRMSDF